jgi:hypothetical protein
MVHEDDDTVRDDVVQSMAIDRHRRVIARARHQVPGGIAIDRRQDRAARVAATRAALDAGARVIYDAAFEADGLYVSIDILEREPGGFVVLDVVTGLSAKERYIAHAAVLRHVARLAGLDVARVDILHIDRAIRHSDLPRLFARVDVTGRVPTVPEGRAAELAAVLAGPLPEAPTGPHCREPRTCPFLDRCFGSDVHAVETLYRVAPNQIAEMRALGIRTVDEVPERFAAGGPARRQVEAVRSGRLVVEGDLVGALQALEPPLAFLDFETLNPAVPAWPGHGPYEQVPVQLSCHRSDGSHHEWLAEAGVDPREPFARALLDACAGARTIVAYGAEFERKCVRDLAAALPSLAGPLHAIADRIADLCAIVRNHVYHPDFRGSFSIKRVLPALVPDLGYGDLAIRDGRTAASALETLLLDGASLDEPTRRSLREQLLRYCERDTLAMVRLHDQLRSVASSASPPAGGDVRSPDPNPRTPRR